VLPQASLRHRACYGLEGLFVRNDATVKGGPIPASVKKHLRAQEIAMQNRLPCIYLVDSGGAFLPMQDEVFPDRDHFRAYLFNQRGCRQRAYRNRSGAGLVHSGGAYVPAMSTKSVIVKGNAPYSSRVHHL